MGIIAAMGKSVVNKPTGSWTITQIEFTDGVNFDYRGGPGPSGGSISGGGTLSDGKTISAWYDSIGFAPGTFCQVSVSGFSSDPTQSYVTSFTAHGLTFTTAAASTYNYSAGSATWTWNSLGFGFTASGTTAASVP